MCFIVPSMAQLIVAHPTFATADLTSIQLCAIGSAPLAPATLVAMQERMPEAAVSNSYGMTEAGPAFCAMPKGESLRRIGSVGQPMPPLESGSSTTTARSSSVVRWVRWRSASRAASAILPRPRSDRRDLEGRLAPHR